jgi:hypothetical protein
VPSRSLALSLSSHGVREHEASDTEVCLSKRRSLNLGPLRLDLTLHVAYRVRTLAFLISNLLMREPRVTIRRLRGPE